MIKAKTIATIAAIAGSIACNAQTIRISTAETDLFLKVSPAGRLYQVYLGEKLANPADADNLDWKVYAASDASVSERGWEVYSCSGCEDFFEPALALQHADGNATTYLFYVSHEQTAVEGGTATTINLRDKVYPIDVKLHYVAYTKENVITTWTEISHREKKPVTLSAYASAMLYFGAQKYFLTEFSSDWSREAQMSSQQLQFGKKVIDTKLGSRAAMHTHPFFELGIDEEVSENHGTVLMGTLGWTGNFRFTFEIDNVNNLRVIPGINPTASIYRLAAGEVFKTPEFIFTLSTEGTSKGSRCLHEWARNYSLKDGKGSRLSLLNNWENTAFDFNQQILADLMKEASRLGVDLFLLDDGWFANGVHERKDDHAGLGDWDVNREKLPQGIPALCDAAEAAGVKFGIWIEPEMVNPNSELFEKHPDWAIRLDNRETYYYRNQLVLDLANPKVQDYVFGVIEKIMTADPRVAFFKWDCNSPITNIHSPYLKENQGRLYIDHVRGIYNVLERVKEKYPDIPMMLCSGGGARCDYEALKYFTEFWCSDDTDPIERCFIQWGFSQFFPSKAMCAHVTSWNKKASVKFRTDVASMCKLGFDIGLHELSDSEIEYCHNAVANWKRLQNAILDGDQYRLVSPYDCNHMAVNYVSHDRNKAVLFAYDLHPRYKEVLRNVKLQGLVADRLYRIDEINLMPGEKPSLEAHGKVLSGDYLMKIGLNVFTSIDMTSHVVEITAL